MIKSQSLERHFNLKEGCVKAVDNIELNVLPGDFVAIMGPSGSGKSTLLYVLGAMDKPTNGWIKINNKHINQMSDEECSKFRNLELGFVFQSFHMLPRLNLQRNVEIPMIYAGIDKQKRQDRSKCLLEAVGLGDRLDRLPTEISGGQCQRAAIARALANSPALLLADEPTGNLDSKTGREIVGIFQALNRAGMTIVMVTHDVKMAQHATRIINMKDGKIIDDEQVSQPLIAQLDAQVENKLMDGINAVNRTN